MIRSRWLFTLVCPVLSVFALITRHATGAPTPAPGANSSDPQFLFASEMTANNLDNEKLTPWHLTASFETYAADGKVLDTGVYEEWRTASNRCKRTYTSATYKQTEYESEGGNFLEMDTGAPPWPLSLVGRELVHPMPGAEDTDGSKPELRSISLGSVKLDCIMLSQPYRQYKWPLGLFPTYCFGKPQPALRVAIFDGNVEEIRNQLATFQGIYLSKDIQLTDDKKPLLKITLLSLSSMSQAEAAQVNAMPGFARVVKPEQVQVNAKVMSGHKIGGPNPVYPFTERQNHTQGLVKMSALIGTDGHVHQLRVLSSPDEALAISAMAAVERWTYAPYTWQGKPVPVETEIHVVYALTY